LDLRGRFARPPSFERFEFSAELGAGSFLSISMERLEWKTNEAPLAQCLPSEILRIREPAIALETGPSDQVVVTIRRTFNLVRQDKKRVNALGVIALLLGVLALAAVWQSMQATKAKNSAEEQRDRAQRVLDQITASANARVMAFAERAQAETGAA